jgi:O-antigen/teichoic acid export membrane protein
LFVPTCVATAILPIISDMKGSADRRLRKVTRNHALLVLAITVPLVLLVAVSAPKLIALFGASYRPASTVLVLLALSSVPMALNTVFGQILLTANAAWIRFGFDAVLSAILLLAAVVLVPAFHGAGLAAANLIGFTIVVVGLIFVCRKFAF